MSTMSIWVYAGIAPLSLMIAWLGCVGLAWLADREMPEDSIAMGGLILLLWIISFACILLGFVFFGGSLYAVVLKFLAVIP